MVFSIGKNPMENAIYISIEKVKSIYWNIYDNFQLGSSGVSVKHIVQ